MSFQNINTVEPQQLMQNWLNSLQQSQEGQIEANYEQIIENKENMISFMNQDLNKNSRNQQFFTSQTQEDQEKQSTANIFQSFQNQFQSLLQNEGLNNSNQFQIDPQFQKLFTQSTEELNLSNHENLLTEDDQVLTYQTMDKTEQQNEQNNVPQQQVQISPEYMEMFTQFYQFFLQLQQQYPNTDPTQILMSIMMGQQQFQQQNQNAMKRDYQNLPLDAIPEKESLMEDQSNLMNTGLKKNGGGLMSCATSYINSDVKEPCQCCNTCQEKKRRSSIYGSCSNFIPSESILQKCENNINQNYQTNQQSNNKVFGAPRNSVQLPSPSINPQQQDQVQQNISQINKNLNQVYFANEQNNYQSDQFSVKQFDIQYQEQDHNLFNFLPNFASNNDEFIQNLVQQENLYIEPQIIRQTPISPFQNKKALSPNQQQMTLSPSQQQQNKLIEYMIDNDNDDFSNFKPRRTAIRGGNQQSRTLSRSNNKGSNVYLNNGTANNYNQFGQNQVSSGENQIEFYKTNLKQPENQINYDTDELFKNKNMYFSPQVPNYKGFKMQRSFEDQENVDSEQKINYAPLQERQSLQPEGVKKEGRQKTQEKIKEIRKLNQKQRSNINVKVNPKSKLNVKKKSMQVFEIKDLKKSNTRKDLGGAIKQESCKVKAFKIESHQPSIQYSEQSSIETMQEQISQQEEQFNERKESINTFKSLQSIWKRQSSENQLDDYDQNEIGDENIQAMANLNIPAQLQLQKAQSQIEILLSKTDRITQPGKEIHIIKKPKQTEELCRIQERLNRYYQDKTKDDDQVKKIKQLSTIRQMHQEQIAPNSQNQNETLSMTKTLSSFKSLMMKTMSQMSVQQDQNIQNQYAQGKRQRTFGGVFGQQQENDSICVSSIQDDQSCVDFTDNINRLANQKSHLKGKNQYDPTPSNLVDQPESRRTTFNLLSPNSNHIQSQKKPSCLPNVLFFRQQSQIKPQTTQKYQQEDTLSLKCPSRKASLCFCGLQQQCSCEQKKDLLGHFQNFLYEMDSNVVISQQKQRESIQPSPISKQYRQENQENKNLGRSSSYSSRQFEKQRPVAQNSNTQQNQQRDKRLSSGSTLSGIVFNHPSVSHCQSTQNMLPAPIENEWKNESLTECNSGNQKVEIKTVEGLEKQDTNQDEQMRLLNIENNMMQQAFIQKSHRLNLQDEQRKELLDRIQKYKVDQQTQSLVNNISQGILVQGSQQKLLSHQRMRSSDHASNTNNSSSKNNNLEERRKVEKMKKNLQKIKNNQQEIEHELYNYKE